MIKRHLFELGGLKAQRTVVRYYDRALQHWMVEDFIAAIQGSTEYSLYLRARPEAYAHDRKIFDAVIKSFTLRGSEQ